MGVKVHLFWRKRPTDKQPWPALYQIPEYAHDAPDRVSSIVTVEMPPQEEAEKVYRPLGPQDVMAWMCEDGTVMSNAIKQQYLGSDQPAVRDHAAKYTTPLYKTLAPGIS